MRVIAILISAALGGCATTQPAEKPSVSVEGPKFARSQFDCGEKPIPPDPATSPTGKAAARHDNALGAYGDRCQAQLSAVGMQLLAAGQVVTDQPARKEAPRGRRKTR